MKKFCVAYKNEYTTKIDEQRGSACEGWVRISAWCSFESALNIYKTRITEFDENTAVGIFPDGDDDLCWWHRRPRRLHNRYVLFCEANVRLAFGGLINSAHSGMF